MSKKMTAVEWLKQKIKEQGVTHYFTINELIRKAIQMEREQHKETWLDSTAQFSNDAVMDNKIDFEIYYTQTYGECTHKS